MNGTAKISIHFYENTRNGRTGEPAKISPFFLPAKSDSGPGPESESVAIAIAKNKDRERTESSSIDRRPIRARRTRLQAALLEKVPRDVFQFGKKLVALHDVDDNDDGSDQGKKGGVRLVFQDGTEATADLVVGADGIRSVGSLFPFGPYIRALNLSLIWIRSAYCLNMN